METTSKRLMTLEVTPPKKPGPIPGAQKLPLIWQFFEITPTVRSIAKKTENRNLSNNNKKLASKYPKQYNSNKINESNTNVYLKKMFRAKQRSIHWSYGRIKQ